MNWLKLSWIFVILYVFAKISMFFVGCWRFGICNESETSAPKKTDISLNIIIYSTKYILQSHSNTIFIQSLLKILFLCFFLFFINHLHPYILPIVHHNLWKFLVHSFLIFANLYSPSFIFSLTYNSLYFLNFALYKARFASFYKLYSTSPFIFLLFITLILLFLL